MGKKVNHSERAKAVMRVASALGVARHTNADPETIANLERDLRAAQLAAQVEKVVEQFPPLTDAQRDRIASLLRPDAA